jgi:hypothetical protein
VYNILIAGAGQLGSRYLQGLSKVTNALKIYIYDISLESLLVAKERWEECNNNIYEVEYISDYNKLPNAITLAIVSSTANVRVEIIKNILQFSKVEYWILEKILAQSINDINEIKNLINDHNHAWVNTPMHTWPLYKELLNLYPRPKNLAASFLNFRGLACNSIHYIDLISRWTNAEIENIDVSHLSKFWIPSKRLGFYEIEGKLNLKYKDGSILNMTSKTDDNIYCVEINVNDDLWKIYENEGYAINNKGERIKGAVLYQSDLTPIIVDNILMNGLCELPTLLQSINQHLPLLESLTNHWNNYMEIKCTSLPIT